MGSKYQFSVSHILATTTLVALQLGLIALAIKNVHANPLRVAVPILVMICFFYVPSLLIGRHSAKKKLGTIIREINNPVHRSRVWWAIIFAIVVSMGLLLFNEPEGAVLFGCLNLINLALATLLPTAILGSAGIVHSVGVFTAWEDWEVVQESRSVESDYLIIKARLMFLTQKLYIDKQLQEIDTIERLVSRARKGVGIHY